MTNNVGKYEETMKKYVEKYEEIEGTMKICERNMEKYERNMKEIIPRSLPPPVEALGLGIILSSSL